MDIEVTYYWEGLNHLTNPSEAELANAIAQLGAPRRIAILKLEDKPSDVDKRYVYELSYDH